MTPVQETEPDWQRVGFICPECGCIKDSWDVEFGVIAKTRWCHNYRAHGDGRGGWGAGRRKMRPTVLYRYSREDPLCRPHPLHQGAP